MRTVLPPSNSTSDPVVRAGRAGQLIAGTGAVLALLGPFSDWLAGAGAFILVLGVVLAAPVASRPGPHMDGWWAVCAVAALAALAGFGLGFVAGWLGGIVLTGAAVTALVAIALGTPAAD